MAVKIIIIISSRRVATKQEFLWRCSQDQAKAIHMHRKGAYRLSEGFHSIFTKHQGALLLQFYILVKCFAS